MSHPLDDSLAMRVRECLVELAGVRHANTTVCPSEVARRIASDFAIEWQELMRPVRTVAAALVDGGDIEVLQDGVPVDIRSARGPVRFRLKR